MHEYFHSKRQYSLFYHQYWLIQNFNYLHSGSLAERNWEPVVLKRCRCFSWESLYVSKSFKLCFCDKRRCSTVYCKVGEIGNNYRHHIVADIGLSNLQNTHVTSRFTELTSRIQNGKNKDGFCVWNTLKSGVYVGFLQLEICHLDTHFERNWFWSLEKVLTDLQLIIKAYEFR